MQSFFSTSSKKYSSKKVAINNKEKMERIQRENMFLVQRMSQIMVGSKSTLTSISDINKLEQNRFKQTMRIHKENQSIMQRLETKKSFYSTQEWTIERQKTLKYLENISTYPDKFYKERERLPKIVDKHGSTLRNSFY
jgi:hypothetical protein